MVLSIFAVIGGLALLTWAADKFVDGASSTALHLGLSPLLIGMLIIGFGTSAPELMVSVMAALDNASNLALGNAYGSNIVNIALMLGITAIIFPITVSSRIVRREIPLLILVMLLVGWQLYDGRITRFETFILLAALFAFIGWAIHQGRTKNEQLSTDPLGIDSTAEFNAPAMTMARSIFWVVAGLILLIVSSRLLVWGAVEIATALGISDLVIGLTVVALGTSLPELASCIAAVKKGEHDLAIGNIIGSNMFNALAVVGVAGLFGTIEFDSIVFTRDWMLMFALTLLLLVFCIGHGGKGRLNRIEAAVFLLIYTAYVFWLFLNP